MRNQNEYESWKKKGNSYIKIKVGDKYECIFKGMEFDPQGGMKKSGAMKYMLEDHDDHKIREFSSASMKLHNEMVKLSIGDRIIVSSGLNDRDQKSYDVTVVQASKGNIATDVSDEDEEEEEEDGEPKKKSGKKIPF
jgi:hypothetical protein